MNNRITMDDEKKIFLLFSADVINSTAMKSRLASQSNGWLPIFNRFYKAFPKTRKVIQQ